MVANIIEHFKQYIDGKYVLEIKIWGTNDKRYPSGFKYSLVFIEPVSDKKVLMDNHHPKKPHVHLNDVEIEYLFSNIDNLMKDFKKYVFKHFGVKI